METITIILIGKLIVVNNTCPFTITRITTTTSTTTTTTTTITTTTTTNNNMEHHI